MVGYVTSVLSFSVASPSSGYAEGHTCGIVARSAWQRFKHRSVAHFGYGSLPDQATLRPHKRRGDNAVGRKDFGSAVEGPSRSIQSTRSLGVAERDPAVAFRWQPHDDFVRRHDEWRPKSAVGVVAGEPPENKLDLNPSAGAFAKVAVEQDDRTRCEGPARRTQGCPGNPSY